MATYRIDRKYIFVVVFVLVVSLLMWQPLPVQAMSIEPVNYPFSGFLGMPVTLAYNIEIDTADLSAIYRMDLIISHTILSSEYRATFFDIPVTTSSVNYSDAVTGGGPGNLSVTTRTSGLSTFLDYSLTWTPSPFWIAGIYNISVNVYSGPDTYDILYLEETISLTGCDPSVIRCTWQTPDDGDSLNNIPGTQVLPPLKYGGQTVITTFAIVQQENPEIISQVDTSVFYPDESPGCGDQKLNINLTAMAGADGIQAFESAYFQGLVSCQEAVFTSIMDRLQNGEALVYAADTSLAYCDPAGDYRISTSVTDINGVKNTSESYLLYVPMTAFEIDFNSVSYGKVDIGEWQELSGDMDFETIEAPTIRNIGNTNVVITIAQDDMGLEEDEAQLNVKYMARLGAEGTRISYDADSATNFPESLALSETQSLDFWIQILRAIPGDYSGSITISGSAIPFDVQN